MGFWCQRSAVNCTHVLLLLWLLLLLPPISPLIS
jgi:hypothetical protein